MSIAPLICLLIGWPVSLWAWLWGGAFAKTLEANRLFSEKRFAQAATRYRDALVDAPTEKALHYNLGTVLYEQKQYNKAVGELEKATDAADPLLAAKVHFNLGNCRFRQAEEALRTHQVEEYGKLLLQAIEFYIRSLEFNPEDQDAKFNLELARKRYLERPQPPRQPPPPSPSSPKKPSSQQPSAQPQRPNGSPPDRQKGQSSPTSPAPSKAPKQEGQTAPQSPQGSQQSPGKGQKKKAAVMMALEEARRLLDSLADEEQNTQKQLLQALGGGERYVEKDW